MWRISTALLLVFLVNSGNSIPSMSLSDFLAPKTDFSELKHKNGHFSFFELTNLPKIYIDSLRKFRSKASECIDDSYTEVQMADGSFRRTVAKMSSSEEVEFPSCLHLTEVLHVFDQVQKQVLSMIEVVSGRGQLTFISQGTEQSLEKGVSNKDHAHIYYRKDDDDNNDIFDESKSKGEMVPWHTDNGLFLILTSFPDHPLLLGSQNEPVKSSANDESILVLFGAALDHWLFSADRINGAKFKSAPHAVPALDKKGRERSVLARMAVVPMDAYIKGAQKVHFGDIFMKNERKERLSPPLKRYRRDLDEVVSRACEEGTAMCWMMCLDLDENCTENENICLNSEGLECRPDGGPEGVDHDVTCAWQCQGQEPNYGDKYCIGGTDMLMGGFETQFASSPRLCLILFIDLFTLDSPMKFVSGCIAVFLLGILIEFLVMIRRTKCNTRNLVSKLISLLCFALNLTLAYLAMLVAMTYSVELFVSVIIGLAAGHLAFNLGGAEVGENVDPCCIQPQRRHENEIDARVRVTPCSTA